MKINPKDVDTLDNKGLDLETLGNHTGALEYFDKALAVNPKNVGALNGKGDTLENLGNYTEAIKYYDKALAINPKYVEALDNKGLALDNLGNHTEAILYFDKALAIQPNDTYALNNKGAALNNLGNYTGAILYYNKALAIDPNNIFALTNKDAILHMFGNNNTYSTYENSTYGIRVQYPSDWTVQGSNASGTPINIATLVSPTGPNSNPTAEVSVYMDKLHNSTTKLNNYAHFVAFADYENITSYFHTFKLLELSTNSSILAGKPAYTLIGTYQDPSAGLQKVMEVGTIIGDKAYSVQYIVDAPKYSSYLPAAQRIIGSLVIENSTAHPTG